MSDKAIKALVSMMCITVLEGIAIMKGLNGTYLAVAVAAIAGIGGYVVGSKA